MMNSYGTTLLSSFESVWPVLVEVGIRLIVALAIFIIGWIIGAFVASLIEKLFVALKVDSALRHAGVEDTLRKGDVRLNSGAFVGALVKWFIIVVFLLSSFQVLGLDQVTMFLQAIVVMYLPQVIVSVLILLVAVVIGDLLQKIVRSSAKTAGFNSAALLGAITKWIIWVFAILTVLVQLGIGADLIRILFTGIVVAVSIAFGLAFGLGGQAHASELIEKIKREVGDK
jgi:hypothetical protein